MDRRSLGAAGEATAARYLQQCGYTILDRNVRTPHGEIDLIAQDAGTIVFVEVKTRHSLRFGSALEALTKEKLQHLADASAVLRASRFPEAPFRIDVVTLEGQPPNLHLTHLRNVEGEGDH